MLSVNLFHLLKNLCKIEYENNWSINILEDVTSLLPTAWFNMQRDLKLFPAKYVIEMRTKWGQLAPGWSRVTTKTAVLYIQRWMGKGECAAQVWVCMNTSAVKYLAWLRPVSWNHPLLPFRLSNSLDQWLWVPCRMTTKLEGGERLDVRMNEEEENISWATIRERTEKESWELPKQCGKKPQNQSLYIQMYFIKIKITTIKCTYF